LREALVIGCDASQRHTQDKWVERGEKEIRKREERGKRQNSYLTII